MFRIIKPTMVGVQLRYLADHKKQKIIFANGCFDLLHIGHVNLLSQAKAIGGYLLVAVNSDESTMRLKGINRPIHRLNDRMEVLSNLRCVDFVTWFDEDNPLELIKQVKPEYIVKGGDYKVEDIVGYEESKQWKGQIKTFPLLPGISTTTIIRSFRTTI